MRSLKVEYLYHYLWVGKILISSLFCCLIKHSQSDSICPKQSITCVECSTLKNEAFCADPFNKSITNHNHLKPFQNLCDGFCVKWVQIPIDTQNVVHYTRTCSKNLHIHLSINLVCIHESRSGNGHMCFCDKDNCNSKSQFNTNSILMNCFLCLLCFAIFLKLL